MGVDGLGVVSGMEVSPPHAVAKAMELAALRNKDDIVVVCLSGRGDKDAYEIARLRGEEIG